MRAQNACAQVHPGGWSCPCELARPRWMNGLYIECRSMIAGQRAPCEDVAWSSDPRRLHWLKIRDDSDNFSGFLRRSLGGSAPKLPGQNFARKLRLINTFFSYLIQPSLSLCGEVLFYIDFKRFPKDFFYRHFRLRKVHKQYVVPQNRAASVLPTFVFFFGLLFANKVCSVWHRSRPLRYV